MITKFHVENLFGIYNNTINFNKDEKITILLGPNGCGKTTMLIMLEAILSLNHRVINKYRFDFVELIIDDNNLKIFKNTNVDEQASLKYFINDKEIKNKNNDKKDLEWIKFTTSDEKQLINDRIMWNDYILHKSLDEDIYYLNEKNNSLRKKHLIKNSIPSEVLKILSTYKDEAYFISTNRLITTIKNIEKYNNDEIKNSIQVFSDELKSLLKNSLTIYANVSQKLDEQFPTKVIKAINANKRAEKKDLEYKIIEVNNLRNQIISSGILEHNSENWLKVDLDNIDESTQSMLTVYYDDTEQKLQLLSSIADKLSLFLDMVNNKLGENKMIKVSNTNGIQIYQKTSENPINLENLSSGEQQEIILLYQLVFKTSDKHLLLIDEPEISLHVMWQRQFIDDLRKIVKINNFNIVIATHSPQIINNNWNLTNKLGEVE